MSDGGGDIAMAVIVYLNLTNGLEFMNEVDDFRFCRIQSTHCEQKLWSQMILEIENDMLMNLAIGNTCMVVDAGKRGRTRALWQGLEFLKYALHRCWLDCEYQSNGRASTSQGYFSQCYSVLSQPAKSKLKYYRKFLLTDTIRLYPTSKKTVNDGRYDYFKSIVKNELQEVI